MNCCVCVILGLDRVLALLRVTCGLGYARAQKYSSTFDTRNEGFVSVLDKTGKLLGE
jgi:hypothetical protein